MLVVVRQALQMYAGCPILYALVEPLFLLGEVPVLCENVSWAKKAQAFLSCCACPFSGITQHQHHQQTYISLLSSTHTDSRSISDNKSKRVLSSIQQQQTNNYFSQECEKVPPKRTANNPFKTLCALYPLLPSLFSNRTRFHKETLSSKRQP